MNSQTYRSGVEICPVPESKPSVLHISISGAYSSPQTFGAIKMTFSNPMIAMIAETKMAKENRSICQKMLGDILSCFTGLLAHEKVRIAAGIYTSLPWKVRPLHEAPNAGGALQLRSLRPDFASADASVCSAFAAYRAQSGGPKNNCIAKHQASALPHLTMKRKV